MRLKIFTLCCLINIFLTENLWAQPCKTISTFQGLIFDAGAFTSASAMEEKLDYALSQGVEKVVLFPHPLAQHDNTPRNLENLFPDLVVQGANPWGKADSVVWPQPFSPDGYDDLEDDLLTFPDRNFLLSNLSALDLNVLSRLVGSYKNLWLGLNDNDVKSLGQSCATGPLRHLLTQAQNRVVYTSFGLKENWKNYKWQISRFKKLTTLFPEHEAEGLIFRNAEDLYGLSVNAP